MSKTYIKFEPIAGTEKAYLIKNLKGGQLLGSVEWYSPWRQWIFASLEDSVWSDSCLEEVQVFMRGLKKP